MASRGRSTSVRDRHRAIIAKTRPPCGICGEDIDYSLPRDDPGSFVVDHIIPLQRGGSDELWNKQAAHRSCNRDKSDRIFIAKVTKRSGSIARPSTVVGPSAAAEPSGGGRARVGRDEG